VVKRLINSLQNIHHRPAFGRLHDPSAHAETNLNFMALNAKRKFKPRKKALGQARQLARIVRARYKQYKFISPQPNRCIMRPDFLTQNIAQL